jgi:hypothetical protein
MDEVATQMIYNPNVVSGRRKIQKQKQHQQHGLKPRFWFHQLQTRTKTSLKP